MSAIPIIDLEHDGDAIDWSPIATVRRSGAALLRALNEEGREYAGVFWPLLQRTVLAGYHMIGSNFGPDPEALADVLGVPLREILTANLSYELDQVACSTFVVPSSGGPLHARNLDWGPLPRQVLRTYTTVIRVHGAPAGDYVLVTWPGFFGAVTGIAPGRFSVTVNYVKHTSESSSVLSLLGRLTTGWPVPWAVRIALDEAEDFESAVRFLRRTPLLAPALFTVAGTKRGEQVVIEREVGSSAARCEEAGLCVTNHYLTPRLRRENVDADEDDPDDEMIDSLERLDHLERAVDASPPDDVKGAFRLLSHAALISESTAHQVVMRAADGMLAVRVPGRRVLQVSLT